MEEQQKRYGFVVDGELFHVLNIPDAKQFERLNAGLQSFPMVIDISELPEVSGNGWKFIEGEFIRDDSAEEIDEGPGYELDD